MHYTVNIHYLLLYIFITYVIGGLLLSAKHRRRGYASAHDDLNFLISPFYIPVLGAFMIANWIYPDKFNED